MALEYNGSPLISGNISLNTLTGNTSVGITLRGYSTRGGTNYLDLIQGINTINASSSMTLRLSQTGEFEFIDSGYTTNLLSISQLGEVKIPSTATSNSDGIRNFINFNNNNSQIYDDGNMHIHSRGNGQSMWINTNGGQLNLLTQIPYAGATKGTGLSIGGDGTLIGFVTINTGKTYTTSTSYGYLTTGGAGTYPGGSQTVILSLYATNRIWGQEIDAFSDERMKDIIGDVSLSDSIELVNKLNPIRYTWKDSDDKGIKVGYSAQQVSKAGFDHLISVLPKIGLGETIDDDGFVSPKDTQFSMNYDQVIPYHGKVIKHLLEKIENLEGEIKNIKALLNK